VTLLEGLAAVLLILGSVLVLRTVLMADLTEGPADPLEAAPDAPPLRRAA
jgi:hypothetical protein